MNENLESRLTALLLGELPASEAFELGRSIEQNPELAQLYQRLEKTIGLVKQTSSAPEDAQSSESLKLSDDRRQVLLQQFKTVKPKALEKAPARTRKAWLQVAALIAVLAAVASVMISSFSKKFAMTSYIARFDRDASGVTAPSIGSTEPRMSPSPAVPASAPPRSVMTLSVGSSPSRDWTDLAHPTTTPATDAAGKNSTPPSRGSTRSPIILPPAPTVADASVDYFYQNRASAAGEQQKSISVERRTNATSFGDAAWIGILEQPPKPAQTSAHSDSNRFVGRYAYMVPPSNLDLALNGGTWSTSVSRVTNSTIAFNTWAMKDPSVAGVSAPEVTSAPVPARAQEFRYYSDLNTSGTFDPNGSEPAAIAGPQAPAAKPATPPLIITGITTLNGNQTAAITPSIDPTTGLPLPLLAEGTASPAGTPPVEIRTFKVDPSKLAEALEHGQQPPATAGEQAPLSPGTVPLTASASRGQSFGASGGAAVGFIGNVTRTNDQIALQNGVRQLLTDSGVTLNGTNGTTVYYNDRKGELLAYGTPESLQNIDAKTRGLQAGASPTNDAFVAGDLVAANSVMRYANPTDISAGLKALGEKQISQSAKDLDGDKNGTANIVNVGDLPSLGRLFASAGKSPASNSPSPTPATVSEGESRPNLTASYYGGGAYGMSSQTVRAPAPSEVTLSAGSHPVQSPTPSGEFPGITQVVTDDFGTGTPAASLPNIGPEGRQHRGTPWQTIYSTNALADGATFWDDNKQTDAESVRSPSLSPGIVLPPAEHPVALDATTQAHLSDSANKHKETYDRSTLYRLPAQLGNEPSAANGGNLALNSSTTPTADQKKREVARAVENSRAPQGPSNVFSQHIVGYANVDLRGTPLATNPFPQAGPTRRSEPVNVQNQTLQDDDYYLGNILADEPKEVNMELATVAKSDNGSASLWEKLSGKYERKAQIAVPYVMQRAPAVDLVLAPRTDSEDLLQTEREILRSDDVLGKVVDDQKLSDAWSKKDGTKLSKAEAIQKLRGMVELKSEKSRNLMDVSVKSGKPDEAATLANSVAESFIDAHRKTHGSSLQLDWEKQHLASQERQVARIETEANNPKKATTLNSDLPLRKPSTNAPIPQPEIATHDNAFSTFSLNVSDVSFKLAAASLEKGELPDPAGIRSEEFINTFDYRDPEPPAGVPVGFAWERAQYPFAQNRDLLRFSIKTAAQGRQTGAPLNIVLLLDNSGSMERADRVRIIREALRVLAGQLQPQDKLSVVLFSRTARLLADGVPGSEAAKVADEVSALTPEGGTNLEEAMKLAYQTALRHYLANGINRVVLLTDGAANLGDVEPESLKQKVEANRKQGIALDCFGIGWEGYNDDLLEILSRNGDGRYGFINTPQEAASEFAAQLAGALHVAASDVKVQVEFNPARVKAWRQIGYAKHQLTKEQFRDNTVDAAEIAAAESGNALYAIEVNPSGEGPLGTVRVRFKIPGTSDHREHEWAVPYTGNATPLEQSSPAMRLAATASAFSEWLAASPYATEVNLDRLLNYLTGIPEVYGADPRPKKLEWMLRQTKSLAK